MKHSYGVLGIAAVIATLLISITSVQGQALAEEKAWVLQERTLPAPTVASEALRASIENTPQPNVSAHTHSRKFYDVDNQVTVRGNRDAFYSFWVVSGKLRFVKQI